MLLPVGAAAINGDYLRFAIKEKANSDNDGVLNLPRKRILYPGKIFNCSFLNFVTNSQY